MLCSRCGYEYDDRQSACPICRCPKPASTGFAPTAARFCPSCGQKNSGQFCTACGRQIPSVAPIAPPCHPMTAAYQQSLAEGRPFPKLSGWIKALIVFLVLFQLAAYTGQFMQNQALWSNPEEYLEGPFGSFVEEYFEDPELFAEDALPEAEPAAKEVLFPNGCSEQEFSRLQEGMSYAQVSAIIGGDALQEDPSLETGEDSFAAVWVGENNPYATVTIVFEHDQAVSIISSGNLDG